MRCFRLALIGAAVMFAGAAQAMSYATTFEGDSNFNGAGGICPSGSCDSKAIAAFQAGGSTWEYAVGFPADGGGNVPGQYNWANSPAPFTLSWTQATTSLTLSFAEGSVSPVTKTVAGGLGGFQSMFIRMDGRNANDTTSASLTNLTLVDSSGTHNLPDLFEDDAIFYAQLGTFNLLSDWSLSGDVTLAGRNANAQPSVQIKLADVAPVPLPAAAWLLIGGLGSLFGLGRLRRRAA